MTPRYACLLGISHRAYLVGIVIARPPGGGERVP